VSRRDVLRALGRYGVAAGPSPEGEAAPLPDPDGPWQRFDDPEATFGLRLEAAGGRVESVRGAVGLAQAARGWIETTGARRVYADPRLPLDPPDEWGPGVAGFDARLLHATSCAAILDLVVLPGELAVAENGAVWVDAAGWPHPALHVLPEHLVLVVPEGALVHTLHDAYERLGPGRAGFGSFLCGPSKTADIEQALVVGAHGPRSLAVAWLAPASGSALGGVPSATSR